MTLKGDDLEAGNETILDRAKYHNVHSLTIYIESSRGSDSTVINR